ncbi:MAG TPA: M4 family metallopeptidase [Polyangiaceae bacterium]|nr:M4 family metallopeptidase [Polyangiaceae bacterium]
MKNTMDPLLKLDAQLKLRTDAASGIVRDLRGKLATVAAKETRSLRTAGQRLLRRHARLFGVSGKVELKPLVDGHDARGGTSVTLAQYHGAYRVLSGSIRFHANEDGVFDTINSRLFTDLKRVPRRARIKVERAVAAAQKATRCRNAPKQAPELLVVRVSGTPHLAWEVRLVDSKRGTRGVPAHWVVYVDATSARVLSFYDNVQTGPVVGTGTGYYSGAGSVNAWSNGTTYQLRDTTRTASGGPEIVTNDEDGASPSEDAGSDWTDTTTTPRDANQGAEVDAHRYAADVVDYYQTVHGRNSFDGAGANLVILSHLGTDYSNGYWDGSKVNLGDGTGVAATGDDYECSDDWLAHEFTHAYTQYTCGLQYLNESGALNEAFSDIFAAFITGDWLVFEDTWLKASAPAWRNMVDPTNGGSWDVTDPITSVLAGHQPSHYADRYTGTADNGGVHINSGIINNLFYLLTVGGTHTVSGVSVIGIGQSAAEQLLFRCMTVHLVGNPTATFLDFRVAMLDACLDLFPTDLVKLSQIKNAFNAVGIGPDIYVRDNLADDGTEPYGGTYLYASPDIINRTSAVSSPTTEFADLSDDSLWENVEFGQANYVYVRLQNRGPQSGDATINVYFSAASTFGTPASWIHVGTLNETGIAPGALRISGPLTFPAALIPSPGHYCMITVVSSVLDPAPDHTLIASVSDYLSFVRNTNNIAYRNMDVVDAVPGTPGTFSAMIRTLPGLREHYSLELDLKRFVPGARVRLRGPARLLGGAIARGFKLAERKTQEDTYELLRGNARSRHLVFLNKTPAEADSAPGFDEILIEKDFKLNIDYVLPESKAPRPALRPPKGGYTLSVRQLWKGELVGAFGIRVDPRRTPKDERRPRAKRTRKRRAAKR